MEIDEALVAIKKYEAVVDKYVTRDKVDDEKKVNLYKVIKSACLEALVILQGDEAKFAQCLEAAKKENRGMGWNDFDGHNAYEAASYVVSLAHLMK
ncbi:MAG: hypothetical protein WC852_03455 [Candidatus Nanoarchaeia archaeon]|jgi:hypothetical protein